MKNISWVSFFRSWVSGALRPLFFVLLLGSFDFAFAENIIKSVEGQYKGGREVLIVRAHDVIEVNPISFSTQSPPRIAFDFVGFSSSLGRGAVQLNLRNAKSAMVIQAGDRTRVVFNLQNPAPFMVTRSGDVIEIQLADVGGDSVGAPSNLINSKSTTAPTGIVKDIDFRRAADGAGRVVVELSAQQSEVDVSVKGKSLVIDLPKYSLPDALKRKLDVGDFGTPVQTIVSEDNSMGVRVTISPKGSWEHSAFQTDGRLVVDIRDQKIDPNKLVQGAGYAGEKLSLNFQNIEVRSLLQVIADFTGFNIVTSDTVSGAVTLRLKDVPWDQALDIILQAKSLGMRKNGSVIWVAPKDELAAKEKADLEASATVESLEPLKTQVFQLNFGKAADVAAQLNGSGGGVAQGGGAGAGGAAGAGGQGQRFLSTRGSATAEVRTNQLFVTDIPSKLQQVQELITRIDVAVKQVVIEARIVEADDSFGKTLGARLGGGDLRTLRGGDSGYSIGGGNRVAIGGSYNAMLDSTGQPSLRQEIVTSPIDSSTFVNLPASSLAGAPDGALSRFAMTLFSPSANRFLNLEIQAMESEGKGKLVSSPRLLTSDQVKAIIEQGTEIPYQVTAPNGATVIAFKKAVLKLEVTPQITPDGGVILDLQINKDSPGTILPQGVAIDTKQIKTQALVDSGGTVMIGGIFESTETESQTKVPLLGDVPVLGHLFKTKTNNLKKKELLVFITPRVISDKIRN